MKIQIISTLFHCVWCKKWPLRNRRKRVIARRLLFSTFLVIAVLFKAFSVNAQVSPPSMPILFVHGWCGGPYDWAPFFTSFSTELPSSIYPNQAVYLVQYNSVTSTISFWSEDDPSAGSETTLTPIEEDAIPSDARFFVIQLIDPTATSTDATDSTNVSKISVLNKAYEISQVAANIKTITKAAQINILSHSMGGLDARAYVENMASVGACYDYATDTPDYSAATCKPGAGNAAWTGNVANIITLDTPNTGSPLADSSLRTLLGLDGYTCQATTTTNSVEITPSNALLGALNYGGTELGGALPDTLNTPVQALEDYVSNATKSWTGLNGYSDDVVLVPSQSITENIPPADATATLTDLPLPYLSSTVLSDADCTVSVPILGKETIMHFLSCLGTLDPTVEAVETRLIDDTVPWISSWSVTPSTQPLGSNFTIGYSAMDLSSYTLARAELWRAPDNHGAPGTWSEAGTPQTLSGSGPTPVSFTDAPASAGVFWYGSHLYDSGGNEAIQFPPTQVTVTPVAASAPGFLPVGGTYTAAQSVTISDATSNVTIYYTTNGNTPTTGSTIYTNAIAVSSTEKIEAIAAGASNTPSLVSTATYTITQPAATPGFLPAAGTYTSAQSVTISDATSNATIYYTTNGTVPTTSSPIYTAPVVVGISSTPTTIMAIAVSSGIGTSGTGSAKYSIPIILGALTVPVPDTPTQLSGASVTFLWTPGNIAKNFIFYVGTLGPGTSNLYNSGVVTSTSARVTGLPSNDTTLYARLYSLIDGAWQYSDYTYASAGAATKAVLTTPTPNTPTPLSGTSVTFTWTPSSIHTFYILYVGTNGAGSSNLYNSGSLSSTSATLGDLPNSGQTVYVNLYTLIDGVWESNSYTYVAHGSPTRAVLTTPTPDTLTPLSGANVTFAWKPSNINTGYILYVGSNGAGSSNLYNSGYVSSTSATVSDLPNSGQPVYVSLYTLINGAWVSNNYTYVAHGTPIQAALTTPAPDTLTPLSGTRVLFAWTPGNLASNFELWVGTSQGASNLYNSGDTSATSATVSDLVGNGQTIYARLYSFTGGAWQYTDYTYVAYGSPAKATLITPKPGSVLAGSRVTFTWNAGNAATNFILYLGSTGVGSSNLYDSGVVTGTSAVVSGLPVNSEKIYARLYSLIDGAWLYNDYTYTAF